MEKGDTGDVVVLFCGRDMHYGFAFTREEGERATATLNGNRRVRVVQCGREEVDEVIGGAHVIVPLMCQLDRARLEKAKLARLIIQYGAGVEGVDASAARDLGILLSNIPSRDTGNAESCAEMVIFLTLAALRRIREMEESIRTRRLGVPCGDMLKGATVCCVGNGNIARALRPRLRGFGVRQCVLTRRASDELDDDPDVAEWAQVTNGAGKSRVLGAADVVVFACSLNDQSRGMMNDDFLALCKPGVIIINVARGGLLDYAATKRGLETGSIGGMGLDVQWDEPMDPEDAVFKHPCVYCTPHVAGVTQTSYRAMAKVVVDETIRVMIGGERPTIVLN
jgi:phosphoglycerate dehydrogenase-like enzyme